ncbi:MAG: glycosyltransferase family 39 protein [Chloroflexi bacterium]|nr:glycosyltransferase family 39 protein [Chloroflexota bacterium]
MMDAQDDSPTHPPATSAETPATPVAGAPATASAPASNAGSATDSPAGSAGPDAAAPGPIAPGPIAPGPIAPGPIAPERVLLALLLVAAALVRLASPGIFEPNVSTAETVQLAAVEAIAADRGFSLFGQMGLGASGLALLPVTVLRLLRPEPELALRLYAAIGSVAFAGLFYALCRTRFGAVVSLTATALLAFSPWSIFFGRNGELQAFAGCWATAAMLLLHTAMRRGGLGPWLAAGAASTAGLYWHPSAIWTLPVLCVPVVWMAAVNRRYRSRLSVALCLLLAGGLLVAAPRVSALISAPLSTPAMLVAAGAPLDPPNTVRARAQHLIRAFIFLDPSVPADQRYQPPATAPLDSLTGVLLLAGLGLAAWKMPSRALPLAALLIPLVGSQLVSPRVPTLGDALVALPGLYLLVAEALERLVLVLPFPSITRAILLAAIPAYAVFGWQGYGGWIGTPASAQARQPAIDYDEIDAWIGELQAGQPALTARVWRDEHPRLSTGSRVIRRPRETAGSATNTTALARLGLQPAGDAQGEGGARAARTLAASRNGAVYASDMTGHVARLDEERQRLTALQQRAPALEQVSDIAADADGFVYLADSERSLIVKLAPTGEVVATLGGEWGMYRPRGLAIGPDGRIYVADTGRNRLVIGETGGRLVKAVTPTSSFGPFEQPTEVAVDASGRIYVGLPEIGRLAILDESGQVLGGWSMAKGNTIDSARLAVVADGAIAVTDPQESKVRLLDADGRELAVADVPGKPYGVASVAGRLFVADAASGRLFIFALGQ